MRNASANESRRSKVFSAMLGNVEILFVEFFNIRKKVLGDPYELEIVGLGLVFRSCGLW